MCKVVTIGMGYIGLPTSALMANHGIKVHGVDIDKKVVETINKGKTHIVEPDLDLAVKNAVDNGFLTASTKYSQADVFLIVVPTPFKKNNEPDTTFVENAILSVIPFLKEDNLVIIESTCPIGTTDNLCELVYKKRPDLKEKIFFAYCPERVLPGNTMIELENNDRVIGGVNNISSLKAIDFYSKFVKGKLHTTNSRTAEMCKLVENASRDVQIAFANELSLICDKAKIDVWELISLANRHPRVNILQPGCGVGGHCIAIDPYFISSRFPLESKIIGIAREINNYKPIWCIEKIEKKILEFETLNNRKPVIGLFGLAFKPNIDDLRESPAMYISKKIKSFYPENLIFFIEPNLSSHSEFKISNLDLVYNDLDLKFILVAHHQFKKIINEKNVFSFVNFN